MAKQTFTTGSVLTATQMNNLQANDYNWTVSQKTASYVLVAADAGTRIEMNAAGATTVTVNTGLFTAGDTLFIQNIGAGACTVTAGTATVNKATAGSLTLAQYQGGTLYFVSASSAVFFADAGYTPPLTTKGDLFGFDTAAARIPIGSNNQVLTADSTQALGLKWATPSGGGKVLQVVSATYQTQVSGTTSTLTDSGLTASITPSATTSKVLILVTQKIYIENVSSSQNLGFFFTLLRGSTTIVDKEANGISYNMPGVTVAAGAGKLNSWIQHAISYLDSPSTTSATTYKTQVANAGGGFFAAQQGSSAPASSIILMEIGA